MIARQNAFVNIFRRFRYHILCWALFIIYDSIIGGLARGKFGTLPNYVLHYIINITLFYLHAHIVLQYSLGGKKRAASYLVLLIGFELAIYILVLYRLDLFLVYQTAFTDDKVLIFNKTLVFVYLWRSLYFIFISTGYFFFMRYIDTIIDREKISRLQLELIIMSEQTERQLVQAKNAFLLSQISPHFLFNTLNYIYYAVHKNSPIGGKAIMALSKLMRYSSNIENSKTTVMVSSEIEYIETLIFLHQLRQKEKFWFNFEFEEQVKNISIIPLLLIEIAENIFKHADFSNPVLPPYIKIKLESGSFMKIVSGNAIRKNRNDQGLKSGLTNLKERVNIAYNGKADLDYGMRNPDEFFLELIIPIKND